MVLGEICAGKSSVMNVLMAGNYLPVHHGECTRVTCELKAGKYRRAAIHYNEKFNLDPTELQLTTDAETADWRRVRNCINWGYDPGKNQEGDEKKHVEKVIIYWPILHMKDGSNNDDEATSENTEDQELQDGSNNDDEARSENTEDQELQECPMIEATFVDSPGFGANQETYSYLKVRAESCDAYIFVINNASHHDIEADRVQKMMDLLHEHAKSNDTILNPSGTLFICNKWDLVPSDRKESFQREIMKRLQDIWPGIMEEQLFPFSATQALNEIIAENPSEQYCDFMRHICNVVENAVQLKLENHCLWLLRFLERASALVRRQENATEIETNIFQTLATDCRNLYFLEIMKHEIESNSLMIDRNNTRDFVGKGGYGHVIKGSLQKGSTRIQIAAKIVSCQVISEGSSIFRECKLMRQLMLSAKTAEGGEFPPVVFYYGSSYSKTNDEHEVIIVMELCNTDLGKQVQLGYLISQNNGDNIRFPGEEEEPTLRNRAAREPTLHNKSLSYALDIALQAAKGISFIHKNGIVHRDVKPSNYLMCVQETAVSVKITDFGSSIEQNIIATCVQKGGTPHYDAPEIRLDPITGHSFASDVYSFGLVLWEVWYGEQVFDEEISTEQMMQPPIFKAVYPPEPLQLLMQACWKNTPTDRPNMAKVVEELTEIIAQNPRILS